MTFVVDTTIGLWSSWSEWFVELNKLALSSLLGRGVGLFMTSSEWPLHIHGTTEMSTGWTGASAQATTQGSSLSKNSRRKGDRTDITASQLYQPPPLREGVEISWAGAIKLAARWTPFNPSYTLPTPYGVWLQRVRDQQLDDFLTENFTTSLIGPLLSAGFQKFTTAGEIQYRPVYQHTKFSFESSWNFWDIICIDR